MGTQIAIVQSARDEHDVVAFLQGREHLLVVPARLPGPGLDPVELGRCGEQDQLIFLERDLELLAEKIRPFEDRPGDFYLDRVSAQGHLMEWTRTSWKDGEEAQAGRFYFDRPAPPHEPSVRALAQTMSALQRWIKKTYPLRSEERYPMYVGPHCSEGIAAGGIRVVYPNGSPVPLVENR